jgi:hypothetical protein
MAEDPVAFAEHRQGTNLSIAANVTAVFNRSVLNFLVKKGLLSRRDVAGILRDVAETLEEGLEGADANLESTKRLREFVVLVRQSAASVH